MKKITPLLVCTPFAFKTMCVNRLTIPDSGNSGAKKLFPDNK